MSNISVDYDVLNQKQTPAFYASSLATRPAFGYPGRIFIDTDSPSSGIYRDTGSAWVQVADPGAGTTGTLQQVTTNGNSTNLPIVVQNMLLSAGAGTGSNNTGLGINALVFNTTGQSNTAIGNSVLLNNSTGNGNVGVGSRALTANTTGGNNVAIGNDSLYINTTGNSNTGIGTAALSLNTSGGGNTAIGNSALNINTTANYNTAVGNSSLSANTTGANNVAVGAFSLYANTTGSTNTAVGTSALASNTTAGQNTAIGNSSLNANTTGSLNTAVGQGSLQLNTTGANNTAIGTSSLNANTTGYSNTGVGQGTLLANTTGYNNIALGQAALYSNSTGTQNIAIGVAALNNNTTANNNIAIGSGAMSSNTTGEGNIAIGTSTLSANTTANYNTAVGYDSLSANTTGTNNTSLGFQALKKNITAGNNTAIGFVSLTSNTTGSGNTALGFQSLTNNTTGANNVAIGSGGLSLNTTGSNNTTIGNSSGSAITTGNYNTIIGNYSGTATLTSNIVLSDGQANVRLFADANGLIGINQAVGSVPGGQIDIHTAQTYALVLNGLTTNNAYTAFSNNSVGKWRIGNTYNAGANTFDVYNLGTSSNALSINSTTNALTFSSSVTATNGTFYNAAGGTIMNIYSDNTTTDNILLVRGNSGSTIGLAVKGSGNVLINSTTDDTVNKLQVNGSGKFTSILSATSLRSSAVGSFGFNTASNGEFQIYGTAVSGILLAGRGSTTDLVLLNKNGSDVLSVLTGTTTINMPSLGGTGSRAVLADASGNLSAPVSDISVKENISTIGYGLNEVLKMNPVWFNFIDEYKNYGEGRQNGNIAQEMESIIPEAVFITPSTGKMGINYDQLHAVYIKAIQELKAEIDALKNN